MSDSDFHEAIEAGDGTLHGAIDYWQKRAAEAEARFDALRRFIWFDKAAADCQSVGHYRNSLISLITELETQQGEGDA